MTIRSMSKTLAQRSKYREVPGARSLLPSYVTRPRGSVYSNFEAPLEIGERRVVYVTCMGRAMWRYCSIAGSLMQPEWSAEAEGGILLRFVLQEYPDVDDLLLAENIRTTTCGEFLTRFAGGQVEHVLNRL